jgi:hypothetical protein
MNYTKPWSDLSRIAIRALVIRREEAKLCEPISGVEDLVNGWNVIRSCNDDGEGREMTGNVVDLFSVESLIRILLWRN